MAQEIIGIYKITNPSDKIYIGQSVNILKRFKRYKSPSKSQKALYNSFNKYGYDNHIFEILEEYSKEQLNERERYYQDFYNVLQFGLNCRLTCTDDKSGSMSEETKQKMSDNNDKYWLNKTFTTEHKNKIANSNKGQKRDSVFRNNQKERMLYNNPTSKLILDLDTEIFFESVTEASTAYNINRTCLGRWLTGKRKNKKPNLKLV